MRASYTNPLNMDDAPLERLPTSTLADPEKILVTPATVVVAPIWVQVDPFGDDQNFRSYPEAPLSTSSVAATHIAPVKPRAPDDLIVVAEPLGDQLSCSPPELSDNE